MYVSRCQLENLTLGNLDFQGRFTTETRLEKWTSYGINKNCNECIVTVVIELIEMQIK